MPVYPKDEHNIWNDELVKKELEAAGNVVAFLMVITMWEIMA